MNWVVGMAVILIIAVLVWGLRDRYEFVIKESCLMLCAIFVNRNTTRNCT